MVDIIKKIVIRMIPSIETNMDQNYAALESTLKTMYRYQLHVCILYMHVWITYEFFRSFIDNFTFF